MASPDLNELIRQLRKSRQPIYETIVRTIRELINSGEWPENSRLPADKKLAAELGINHITLARALNSLRSQGYLDRRRFHGTFVLAPQKKDISDSVMRKVAVVFDCAHEDTFQQRLFLWLHTYLERSGFAMIFYASDNDPKKQFRQLWQIINDPALSGCIVWPIMPQRMVERLIRKCPGYFPLVTLDRYYTGAELDAATYDNYGCARDMTKTLIAAGVQNLIWLEDSKDHLLSSLQERILGIKAELQGKKRLHCRAMDEKGDAVLRRMLGSLKSPGVVCSTYMIACELKARLREWRIPITFPVAVFETDIEDHEQISEFSAFRFDSRDLAQEAVKILCSRVNGQEHPMRSSPVSWTVIPSQNEYRQ